MTANRPEIELLFCCARTRKDAGTAGRIVALLREEIEWPYLLRKANEHRVTPLLYWHLNSTCPEAVPEAVLEQLKNRFRANNLRNLSLTAELLRLLKIFEVRGVPTVPLKGPVLAALTYENLALRSFGDLDILVRKQDVSKARKLLTSSGYRQEDPLPQSQEAAFLKSQREYVYSHDNGTVVELHWAVMPRNYFFFLDPENLWERLRQVRLGGENILTFSVEDLLLFLCVHGSKHFWYRLAWICDVSELIRVHETIDWEQLIDCADSLGSKRMLFLGLFLAHDLLGAPVPERVLCLVQSDPKVEMLARQVQEWLFEDTSSSPEILAKGELDESSFHPFRVRMRERLRDKVGYCAYTALVPGVEDWQYLSLPKALFPLYYAVRPVRLAIKYGQRLLRQTSL